MSGNRSPEDNTRALLECKHAFKLLFVQFCQFVLLCTAAAKDRDIPTLLFHFALLHTFFFYSEMQRSLMNEMNVITFKPKHHKPLCVFDWFH